MTIRSFLRDFPSPRTTRLGLLLGVPLSLLLGPRLVAWADVKLSKTWSQGDTLNADDLNKNFSDLKAAIDKPKATNPANQKSISTSALSCGMLEPMDGKGGGGYDGLKAKCETACKSPSAHICTAEEMSRSAALGLPLVSSTGRYSGGVGFFAGTNYFTDCDGWSNNASNYYGAYWNGLSGPNYSECSQKANYHCCD